VLRLVVNYFTTSTYRYFSLRVTVVNRENCTLLFN